MMKIFGSNQFSRKWYINNKIFDQKIVDENFWFKPILEEMKLQQ